MQRKKALSSDTTKGLFLMAEFIIANCSLFSPHEKRFFTETWGKSSLGARLRTREITGRDASLPAPLLSAFGILVARGTVGALPQTPQGTLSLDPSARLSRSRFHAPSACSFLVLRLSPCLLPQLAVKNIMLPVTPLLPHPPRHTPPPHPCSHSPAVLSETSTARDDPAPDYTPIESAVRRNPPAPSA